MDSPPPAETAPDRAEATPGPQTPYDGGTRRRRIGALVAVASLVLIVAAAVLVSTNRDDDAPADALPGSPVPLSEQGGIDTGPEEFEKAPDFSVPTIDGGDFTLSEHLATDGRPVFLNFWASWCFPCRAEMPEIDAVAARHPEVLFIGVAVQDDPAAAEEFGREIGVDYLLAIDDRDEVAVAYPTLGLPATYLISPEGVIVDRVFGQLDEAQIEGMLAAAFGG